MTSRWKIIGAGGKRLLAVAALVGALAVPASLASVAQAAATATQDMSVLVTGNFACQIPRLGHGSCVGDRFDVPSGHYVRVENVSSGGKDVKFYLYNTNGHHLLGSTAFVAPASGRHFIWRNDTRQTIHVEFEAEADALVNVTCNARYTQTAT